MRKRPRNLSDHYLVAAKLRLKVKRGERGKERKGKYVRVHKERKPSSPREQQMGKRELRGMREGRMRRKRWVLATPAYSR